MQNTETKETSFINNDRGERSGLSEIIQFAKEGKYWIISSTVTCFILGVAIAFLTPPTYEAVASIQMASITSKDVDTPVVVAEKLKLPSYYSEQTFKVCQIAEHPTAGRYLSKELRPTAIKNASIINLRFRGQSPSKAQRCLESVLADIRKDQATLAKPALEIKQAELRALELKLEASEALKAQLPVKNIDFVFDNSKISGSALLLATLITAENDIRNLRSQISDLKIALSEPQTKQASLVAPIYAPNIEAEPQKLLILLASVFAGLVLGILIFATKKSIIANGARLNRTHSTD
ncbi:subunit length determinant protein [Paucimonas lemoignei]|uniref:Subunit length determinant protein n=1 Tax=Paucimonas lemoignei TaxID=29443 RepID=A0A4R3HS06_PAULE|nr:Wzz/FepE/Etk N-terminal domain-containing protein [Paucimonas lemoignei]TCS35092.1 subunit length determinant protein [Paucimonas lemoignei]